MNLLYHYSSNRGCFGILDDKYIRMSDILNSNDYEELQLFYPDVLFAIEKLYINDPFELKYNALHNIDALRELLDMTQRMIDDSLQKKTFSNFVVCFSEKKDTLSQWRGYADDGKGMCIGFSKENLEKKCLIDHSIFRLEKVRYLTPAAQQEKVHEFATEVINLLKTLRAFIVQEMTLDDDSPDTDGLLSFNFHACIENIMTETLMYKKDSFQEECEWRLFLRNQAYKHPEWVVGEPESFIGPNGFNSTVSYLRNKIKFNIATDNISAYVPLSFSEFEEPVIKSIWMGPKSRVCKGDLELYLAQREYKNIELFHSHSSYR